MSGRRRKNRSAEPADRKLDAAAARPARNASAGTARAAAPHARNAVHRGAVFSWLPPNPALEAFASGPWALPVVMALGLALRLAHLIALEGSPFATSLVLDARYYDSWAQAIAGGAWIGRSAFWVDPLYAYVLGALYTIAGRDLLLSRLLNIVFGMATAWLAFRLGERVWRSRAAALLAALLTITCIPTLYFEGQNEKTALTVLLVTAAAVLFLGGSLRAIAAAGVVTGLAALARGNVLLFVPVAALALWLGWDRDASEPALPAPARRRRAAVFLACALPVVALATLHNWLATREFVLTTTNLGVNLYLGNHGGNTYGYYTAPDFLHPDTGAELPDFRAEGQRRTGHPLTDRELSDYWRGQAWEAVTADPDLALLRTAHKFELALHNDEVPDNEDVRMVAEWSPVLRSPVFWLGQLLALGLLGGVIGWRRRAVRVVATITLIYLASLLPFFIMARLRVQVVPLLAVLGAGAIVWLIEAARRRDARRWLAAAAVVAPMLCLAFYRPAWMAQRRSGSLAIAWNNLGSSLADAGRDDEAIWAYERAVAINASAVPASLRTLGDMYRRRGDYPRAEAAMRQVLEIKPQSRSAQEALRGLYATMQSDPRWRNDPTIRTRAQALNVAPANAGGDPRAALSQARAFAKQGHYDDAIRVLQDAVRRGPYDEGLHYVLGDMMERHATPDQMIQFFVEEEPRDQKPQTSHYFQAVGLARRDDLNGAIAQLQRALEIDPAHEMSQREWGLLLERQGKPAEALDHFVEATRIHPDFKAAYEDAARVAAQLGRTADAETYRQRAANADPNTLRRFVYWARYLHEHGRDEAALAEIQRLLAERPTDPEALALRDQIRGGSGAAVAQAATPSGATPGRAAANLAAGQGLSPEARGALVERLAAQPAGETWIAYDTRDPAARQLAEALAAAFKEAHWGVRSLGPLGFPIKPGLFVLVADQPSERTDAVHEALDRAALTHTVGTGYRAFSDDRRRTDPNWRGAEFAAGQEFIIVVGRQPLG